LGERDEIVKGYEISQGRVTSSIEPSELENLKGCLSKHTIEVNQFVGFDELLPEVISRKPLFSVVPEKNDSQAEAFAVIREALQKSGKGLRLERSSFAGREHIVAIRPAGDEGFMAAMNGVHV